MLIQYCVCGAACSRISYRFTRQEIDHVIQHSISSRDQATKRFAEKYVHGVPYIQATYGHSPHAMVSNCSLSALYDHASCKLWQQSLLFV
jgi:hypothetical protein